MRTKNAFLNLLTSIIPWLILAVLGFIKISLFINTYGSELNGFVQLASQIFAYLGLAEMGFGSAVTYKLYKPFLKKDYDSINNIFSEASNIFKKVGIFILGLSFLFSIVIPFLVGNLEYGNLYVSALFLMYAIDTTILYFTCYSHKLLLIADQKKYKINLIDNIKNIILRFTEVLLIIKGFDFLLILTLSVIFNIFSSFIIIKLAKKYYPWLKKQKQYISEVINVTKDIIFIKLSKLVFTKTDMIIISFTAGLISTSIYASYNYIYSYLITIIGFWLFSVSDIFGNIFADSKINIKDRINRFNEYMDISIIIILIVSTMFVSTVNPFITIWISDAYNMGFLFAIIFSFILFNELIFTMVRIARTANGSFKETKVIAAIQAFLNIGLSFLLSIKLGLIGIILATLITQIVICLPFETRKIYQIVFKNNGGDFYKKYIKALIIFVLIIFLDKTLISYFNLYNEKKFIYWVIDSTKVFLLNFGLIICVYFNKINMIKNRFKIILRRNKDA